MTNPGASPEIVSHRVIREVQRDMDFAATGYMGVNYDLPLARLLIDPIQPSDEVVEQCGLQPDEVLDGLVLMGQRIGEVAGNEQFTSVAAVQASAYADARAIVLSGFEVSGRLWPTDTVSRLALSEQTGVGDRLVVLSGWLALHFGRLNQVERNLSKQAVGTSYRVE